MGEKLAYDGYTLVFEDHFDAARLNRGDWNVELHEPGWVNEEWQRYVDSEEVLRLEDSRLRICAVRSAAADGTVCYRSGRISTEHRHDFTYGLFEARIRVPEGKGLLPAFWLMATDEEQYGGWPACGEIDIMEILGDQTESCYGTIHYGLPHGQRQGKVTLKEGDFSGDFHVFALEWEPGMIRWYADGALYHEESTAGLGGGTELPYPAPFTHGMYVILNLAVGGSWVGYPDETADFEDAVLEVDYVRVYQKR